MLLLPCVYAFLYIRPIILIFTLYSLTIICKVMKNNKTKIFIKMELYTKSLFYITTKNKSFNFKTYLQTLFILYAI